MWPFSERSTSKRIARARQLIAVKEYLTAREELAGVADPEAAELFKIATELQIQRLLREVSGQFAMGDAVRAREFIDIARRLGATEEQLGALTRGDKPAAVAQPNNGTGRKTVGSTT